MIRLILSVMPIMAPIDEASRDHDRGAEIGVVIGRLVRTGQDGRVVGTFKTAC